MSTYTAPSEYTIIYSWLGVTSALVGEMAAEYRHNQVVCCHMLLSTPLLRYNPTHGSNYDRDYDHPPRQLRDDWRCARGQIRLDGGPGAALRASRGRLAVIWPS